MKDFVSFGFVTTALSLGVFAIAAAPRIAPNHEGLKQCMQLHPERYCRIANGFSVPLKP